MFNKTGGDPTVVLDMVSRVATLLEEPTLLLHYYEWQQGPDPHPEKRYLFDTHYPDYFPARGAGRGEMYKKVVEELKEKYSVYTFPYINGRIFDIESDTYLNVGGDKYCTKIYEEPQLVNADSQPVIAFESYGSDATFCVSSPHEPFWQDKIADVTLTLLEDWSSSV